jgi:glycosyltransferase involved in cell wall biosynthesis
LKGAHQLVKALPMVLDKFPNTKLNVVGIDVLSSNWKVRLRYTGYHLYLRRLIKKLKLENNINFTGALTEIQMRDAFLSSHLFVLPSAIENSPNSLCEAQILGMPCIASFVGGAQNLVENGTTGFLYRFEEIEMLGHYIIHVFNSNACDFISSNAREVALKRHNSVENAKNTLEIYEIIINDSLS